MNAPAERRENGLIAYLYGLANKEGESRAELAALRRGLSDDPGRSLGMYQYIARYVPTHANTWEHNTHYLIASLFALHPKPWRTDDAEQAARHNFGASFDLLNSKVESGSIEKRFVALLNADREELPEHLRHAVSLLKAHDVVVDYASLLRDVRAWDAENRWVQRLWARAFWGAAHKQERGTASEAGTSEGADPASEAQE